MDGCPDPVPQCAIPRVLARHLERQDLRGSGPQHEVFQLVLPWELLHHFHARLVVDCPDLPNPKAGGKDQHWFAS